MRTIRQTDVQEARAERQKEENLPVNVDSLGGSIVKERLARLAAEKKALSMGKMVVKSRLMTLRSK